jgi:hypothetical protein
MRPPARPSTGLGQSLCRNIFGLFGGFLEMYAKFFVQGSNTTFVVRLCVLLSRFLAVLGRYVKQLLCQSNQPQIIYSSAVPKQKSLGK